MKVFLLTAQEAKTINLRNHREKIIREIKNAQKKSCDKDFLDGVEKALRIISSRIQSAIIYSKNNVVYYHFATTPLGQRVETAVVKTLTKKGYQIQVTNCDNQMIKITW